MRKPNNIRGLGGTFNDYKHQTIIVAFIHEFVCKLNPKGKYKNYIVFPEFYLFPYSNMTPDISIWKRQANNQKLHPLIIIEICGNSTFSKDKKKVKKLITEIAPIKEGYVINKDSSIIMKFNKVENKIVEVEKFKGNILGVNVMKILNIPEYTF
ncbi:hypothetical protein GWA97_09620 [Flavobacterium sp. LaA7.5]|nr:hypothetical protein [Flavobacterium salilacus subsp. altitudinum]